MAQDVGPEEPADAATAFEALRREVALLKVAVAGLAAERAAVPDYSETLGELSKGISVALGRLGKILTGPALGLSPVELARQIAAAGSQARRQDEAALHLATDALQRATWQLDGWLARARLARHQNWRLAQAASAGMIGGVLVWASAPTLLINAAPAQWAWPERRAAGLLGEDMWSAGERLLSTADPERWRRLAANGSGGQDAGGDKADRGVRSTSGPSSKTAKVRKPRRADRSKPDR
ncbi:MAG: DUF6118 family protein [Caulobacter sp.]